MNGYEGKGAVITGGANGIGFATATEFARRGARVVLADVDKPSLEQAVAHLQAQGFEAHGVMCDVRYLKEMIHLADEAFRLLGQVDVVFSNAGIVVAGPIAQMTHDGYARAINPVHTLFDGDTVFALSTGTAEVEADESAIGAIAAVVMARAIARAAMQATSLPALGLPAWRDYGKAS